MSSRSADNKVRSSGRDFVLVWLVALGFALLGGYYSVVTPIFEAPDELWHYDVVRAIAQGHFADPAGPARQEATQPPLYYSLAAAIYRLSPAPNPESAVQLNPYFDYKVTGATNKNLIYHGAPFERFPYQGIARTVHLIRLLSVALGVLTVIGIYRLASLASGGRTVFALLATGFCALNPEFAFLSGAITNDNAIVATATWTLVFLAQWLAAGTSVALIFLSITLGLALLSKATAFGLAIVVVAGLLWLGPSTDSCRSRLVRAGGVVGGGLLISAWWYIRLALLYHDPLGTATRDVALGRSTPFTFGEAINDLAELAVTFFARFGWTNVAPPAWIPVAYVVVAVAGLGVALTLRSTRSHPIFKVQVLWVAFIMVLFYIWQLDIPGAQGRLIFPAIGSLALLWANGADWILLHLRPVFRKVAAVSLAGSACVGVSFLPLVVIAPAYPPAIMRLDKALPATATPLTISYAHEVTLVGYQISQTTIQPGGTLYLQLFWQKGQHAGGNLSFAAHLLDHQGKSIAGTDLSLAPGLPADEWPSNTIVQTTARILVPRGTPSPQMDQLDVLVYSVQDGKIRSLPVDGSSTTTATIAAIRLPPPATPWSGTTVAHFTGSNGDSIDLVGWSIDSTTLAPGSTLRGHVYWRVHRQPRLAYTVFVHLVRHGHLIAQYDAQPLDGDYPTNAWLPGEIVQDPFVLAIPPGESSGSADLETGLYDLKTMRRLKLPGGDAKRLTTVVIERLATLRFGQP